MASHVFESSNLDRATYDPTTQELLMTFANGGVYKYSDVPLAIWEGLISSDSSGSYFFHNIRNGGYAYERMG